MNRSILKRTELTAVKLLFSKAFVALTLAMAASSLRATELRVFAAASLTDALKEIASDYQKRSGDKIAFNLQASSTLARQIEAGAPVDIFFSADEAKMDDLEKKGLIVAGTRKNLLSNSLVIVVPREGGISVTGPRDLATDKIQRIALAQPDSVPAGIYAREYMQKESLWSSVKPKVIPTENVRAALAAVESGNVDAGIVYKTDAAISSKVKVAYEVPQGEGPKIRYPVAAVKDSSNLESAHKFLEYLSSAPALEVFRKRGFVVLK
jgi:molybdate transport system substrate-binding protein